MRISDWSSDVCSSDLRAQHGVGQDPSRPAGLGEFILGDDFIGVLQQMQQYLQRFAVHPHGLPLQAQFERALVTHQLPEFPAAQDRKSVVSGKSVSVRVDLGGPSILTKKTQDTELRQRAKER